MMKFGVWQKDMTIIADFARQLGCPTPLFAATTPIYTVATSAGENEDTGAVCLVLEAVSVVRRKRVRSAKYKVRSGRKKFEVRK